MEIPSKEEVERLVVKAHQDIEAETTTKITRGETDTMVSGMFRHAGGAVLPLVEPRGQAMAAGRAFNQYREDYEIIAVRVRLRESLREQDSLETQLRLYRSNVSDLLRESGIFSEALEALAKLGNGDKVGNSVGNEMALAALKKAGYPCPKSE